MATEERWKLLTETPDEDEALLIKEALESEGIACRLETIKDFPGPAHGGKAHRSGSEEAEALVLSDAHPQVGQPARMSHRVEKRQQVR